MFKNLSIYKVSKNVNCNSQKQGMTAGKKQKRKPKRMYALSNLETPTDKIFTATQMFKSNDTDNIIVP